MPRSQRIGKGARAALACSAVLLLAACNSDSSDFDRASNGPGDQANSPVRVDTLEYFVDEGAGLVAVAPSQPNAPTEIDDHADISFSAYYTFGVTPVVAAQTATAASANGLHVASVLYPRLDGTLRRAGTDPDMFPPTPVQVSSADNFDHICMRGVPEPAVYTDVNATPFVYVIGADGVNCENSLDAGTATWHFVLAGDDAGTPPRDFPTPDPLVGDFDYSVTTKAGTVVNFQAGNGDNAGWLIRQGGMLTRVGPDGTVAAADITPIADGFEPVVPQLADGIVLLNIDGALTAFDPTDNSVKDLGFALDEPFSDFSDQVASDGREVFINKQNTLYRTTGGGTNVAKIDTDPKDPSGTSRGSREAPLVGSDRVVWLANAHDGEKTLRSVDKTATDIGSGEPIAQFEGDVLSLFRANTDQWLFYGEFDRSTTPGRGLAIALRMDGSDKQTFVDSAWIGYTQASRVAAGSGATMSRIYRVPDRGDAGTLAGKRLLSIAANDPANPGASVDIGIIPSDTERAGGPFVEPGFGSGRLLTRAVADTQTDIWFFRDDQPGSLQRVTDDDDDQFALPGF